MSEYPQLAKMGILNPGEIRSYMVNSIATTDVLRIIYKRKEGSLLPASRSYDFPRVQRTVENAKGKPETVLETAPALRAAVNELKKLVAEREDKAELVDTLLDEVETLESEITWRIKHIKTLLQKV
ncbi:MAG: DUF3461 family protein [Woeseiaceae bacterium]|jgi:hypothetical protein|nr:DUF3461 family protein [Woeseiaceae bacterium]